MTSSQANASGNAKMSYERYVALARAAALVGDAIEAENLWQHSEHYFRLLRRLRLSPLPDQCHEPSRIRPHFRRAFLIIRHLDPISDFNVLRLSHGVSRVSRGRGG